MPAIVQVLITAEYDADDPRGGELGEAVAEQVITASARHWDTSTVTLLRILEWLKASIQGHKVGL